MYFQFYNSRFQNNDYKKTIQSKGKTVIKQQDGSFKRAEGILTNPPLPDPDFKTEPITTKLDSTVTGERKKQLITDKQWAILKQFKIDELFRILSNL